MKLHDTTTEIKTNIKATAKAFTINASQKAFKILSSNLYQNKIGAVIRELSTNAKDAHVAANNPSQFEVHLPSTLEPYFHVKDYGTGMSHEDIINLYTSYFSSTKTDSDDYIGALGLGSKSPFSYTDSFSIESTQEGKKGIYTAIISSEGYPEILHVTTVQSQEPNGLKVSFPVKETDINSFINNAVEIFFAFDKEPLIIGNFNKYSERKKDILNVEEIFSIDGVTLLKNRPVFFKESYYNGIYSYAYAKMGNILYPIEVKGISSLIGVDNTELGFVLSNNFIIEIPLGSCDINPSREALNYDDQTVESLRIAIQRALSSTKKYLEDKIKDSSKTEWEKKALLNSLSSTLKGKCPSFGTLKINEKIKISSSKMLEGYKIEKTNKGYSLVNNSQFSYYANGLYEMSVIPSPQVLFVSKLDKKLSNTYSARIKQYMNQNGFNLVYLAENFEDLPEWTQELGTPPLVYLKDLPLTPAQISAREKQKGAKRDKKDLKKEIYDLYSYVIEGKTIPQTPSKKNQIVVLKNQCFYFGISENGNFNRRMTSSQASHMFRTLQSLDNYLEVKIEKPNIVFIPWATYKKNSKEFSKMSFFKGEETLKEVITKAFKNPINLNNFKSCRKIRSKIFSQQEYFFNPHHDCYLSDETLQKFIHPDSLFKKTMEKIRENEKSKKTRPYSIIGDFSDFSRTLISLDRSSFYFKSVIKSFEELIEDDEDPSTIEKDFRLKYPLIGMALNSYSYITSLKPEFYIDYVNLIDSKQS